MDYFFLLLLILWEARKFEETAQVGIVVPQFLEVLVAVRNDSAAIPDPTEQAPLLFKMHFHIYLPKGSWAQGA